MDVFEILNIISFDVEELFYTEYGRTSINENCEYMTSKNIPIILDLLKDLELTATFFIVGEIAEKFPEICRLICDEGHELAFHGWSHLSLQKSDPHHFSLDLKKFKKMHPQCVGFRAPSFSLNNYTKWALKVLGEQGFCYDSSVFPAWTPLYGVKNAPTKPYHPFFNDISKESNMQRGIVEFPLAVSSFFGFKIPVAGGFWLRFFGPNIVKKGIKKLNDVQNPAVLFVHNWELDPNTPRKLLDPYKFSVTYCNLKKTKKNLIDILSSFSFGSFTDFLKMS